jgi:hypothetical protein
MLAAAEPLVYRPQPKQESWHRCPAYESGFGGAKFGGKSIALLMEAVRGVRHPRYHAVIFRRTYPRLQELLDRTWLWFPGNGARWDGDGHRWVWPSGGNIAFRHCQHEEDKYNYQGHEYQFMGFDQLEEFSESQYTYLLAQNRSGVPDLRAYTRSTFNPGGIGHGWVRKRFIDHGSTECAPWIETNEDGESLPRRCFHFANIDDNPIGDRADPTYRQRLQGLPEADRRALLYGDWDVFAGQFFTEWRRAAHVVTPSEIPEDWPRWRAVDYGGNAPMCCLWFARDHDKRVHVYRELYQPGLLDREQAALIRDLTGDEKIRFTVADPSMWSKQPNGLSIADVYVAGKVPILPANNDRKAGWNRVRSFLKAEEGREPMLRVSEMAANLIRTLPALVRDQHDVEDVDTDGEDHAADALRYGLMGASVQHGRARATSFAVEV